MFGRRDERAAAKWARFADHAARNGLSIVTVGAVYQYARNGTKAVINIQGEPYDRDAWFWWTTVDSGSALAVSLSTGYGPHTHRDGVVYVGSQYGGTGVYDRLSAKTLVRANRHHRRQARKQAQPGRSTQRTTSSALAS